MNSNPEIFIDVGKIIINGIEYKADTSTQESTMKELKRILKEING